MVKFYMHLLYIFTIQCKFTEVLWQIGYQHFYCKIYNMFFYSVPYDASFHKYASKFGVSYKGSWSKLLVEGVSETFHSFIHSVYLAKNKQIQEIFHTLYILKLQLITQYIIEKT